MRPVDYVDAALQRWAAGVLSDPQYYPSSIAGRLDEPLTGQPGSVVPRLSHIDPVVEIIERQLQSLSRADGRNSHKAVQVVAKQYLERSHHEEKAKALAMSVRSYYAHLRAAQYFLSGAL